MPKFTNLLISLVLISTGIISCTNYKFVKKKDIIDQKFVNKIDQNGSNRQVEPQLQSVSTTNQAVPVKIPITKKSLSLTDTENKKPDNIAIDDKHINNPPGTEQYQIKLNKVGLAHLELGIAYAERDQIDQAISEFQSAIEANPHHLESYVRLGTTYGLKGMTNEALSEFKKAIEINLNEAVAKIVFSALPVTANQKISTDVVQAHINLGNAYKEEGKLKKSQLEYERALELKPEHPIASKSLSEIYYSFGTSYMEHKKYDNAVEAFNKVVKLNPGFPKIKDALEKAHYNLGINYAENGKLDKAIIEFNKTMEINHHYAMLAKDNSKLIEKGKKAVTGKQILHDENHPDKKANTSTKSQIRKEIFPENKEEPIRNQTNQQIDIAGEMILAAKGTAEKPEPEYNHDPVENRHPIRLQKSNKNKLVQFNKTSSETEQLQKTDTSYEGPGKKKIQERIAQVKIADIEYTDVKDADLKAHERNASIQVKADNAGDSNTYNQGEKKEIPKESLAQYIQPGEDKTVAILKNSSGGKTDDNKANTKYWVYTYNITRSYKTRIGINDAIKKYEDATINNPYDNNAFLNLAHAYYCKAMYLDDAIARREDAPEVNQNYSVKRFYLNNAGDKKNSETCLTEHTGTCKDVIASCNRPGSLSEEMFREAIIGYKNALRINPNSSNSLYGLAFSFSIKGSHLEIASRDKKNIKKYYPFNNKY